MCLNINPLICLKNDQIMHEKLNRPHLNIYKRSLNYNHGTNHLVSLSYHHWVVHAHICTKKE